MGPHVFDGEETQGGAHRVLETEEGEEGKVAAGRVVEEGGGEHRATGDRDTTVENINW